MEAAFRPGGIARRSQRSECYVGVIVGVAFITRAQLIWVPVALLAVRSVRTHSYLSTRSRSRTNTLTVFSRAPDARGSTHIECRVFRPIAHRRTVYNTWNMRRRRGHRQGSRVRGNMQHERCAVLCSAETASFNTAARSASATTATACTRCACEWRIRSAQCARTSRRASQPTTSSSPASSFRTSTCPNSSTWACRPPPARSPVRRVAQPSDCMQLLLCGRRGHTQTKAKPKTQLSNLFSFDTL